MNCDLCNGETNDLKTINACGHKLCVVCLDETCPNQCSACVKINNKTNYSLFDYLNTAPALNRDYLHETESIDTNHPRYNDKDFLSKNASKLNFLSKSFEDKSLALASHDLEAIDCSSQSSTETTTLSTLHSSQTSVSEKEKVELKEESEVIRLRHYHDENAKSQLSEQSQAESAFAIDSASNCILVTSDHQFVQKSSFNKQTSLSLRTKKKAKKNKKIDFFVIFLLFVINLLNFIDRFTLAGVLKHLQDYFHISDGESGLLQTVFICSYMLLAPLFGYLGDRYSRKWIVICGVTIWSLTTYLGSLVPPDQFWLFVLLRSLVGIGEASYSCVAPTIIGDLFTDSMRTKCLAIFYLAIPMGGGLGYIIGSKLADVYNDWRYALCFTPPVAILFVILFAVIVKEPKRGGAEGNTHHVNKSSILSDTIYLLKNKTYMWITVGFTFATFVLGGLSWWMPSFVEYAVYSVNQTPQDIPFKFGIVTGISGLAGVTVSTMLAPKLREIRAYADPVICAVGSLIAVPSLFCMISVIRTTNEAMFWIITSVGITSMCLAWALVADILLYVIHPEKRSFASAFNILVAHLFGDAFSPFVIGAISDTLRATKSTDTYYNRFTSLQAALYAGPFFAALSFGAYLFAAIYVESDKKEVDMYIKKKSQLNEICMKESPSKTKIKKFRKNDSGIGSLCTKLDYTDNNNNISDVYNANKRENSMSPLLASSEKNLPAVNEINESTKA